MVVLLEQLVEVWQGLIEVVVTQEPKGVHFTFALQQNTCHSANRPPLVHLYMYMYNCKIMYGVYRYLLLQLFFLDRQGGSQEISLMLLLRMD